MQNDQVQVMTASFEGHAQQTENGIEYWLARDLQQLLGYAGWRNFSQTAISKAKTACEISGHTVFDHFVDVNKTIQMQIEPQISTEHTTNNQAVRATLLSRGIPPESLPPAEDVKKVERRLTSAKKKALKNPDTLENE